MCPREEDELVRRAEPKAGVAIEALALRDEEEVRFMDAGQDWQRFFSPGMHRLMSVL